MPRLKLLDLIRRQFRRELRRCTERPGCKADLHLSTCAEYRELIREGSR